MLSSVQGTSRSHQPQRWLTRRPRGPPSSLTKEEEEAVGAEEVPATAAFDLVSAAAASPSSSSAAFLLFSSSPVRSLCSAWWPLSLKRCSLRSSHVLNGLAPSPQVEQRKTHRSEMSRVASRLAASQPIRFSGACGGRVSLFKSIPP